MGFIKLIIPGCACTSFYNFRSFRVEKTSKIDLHLTTPAKKLYIISRYLSPNDVISGGSEELPPCRDDVVLPDRVPAPILGADQQVGKEYITSLRDLSNRGASWHGTFNDLVRHCEIHGITGLPANTIDLGFFK